MARDHDHFVGAAILSVERREATGQIGGASIRRHDH
jgi:hypothetical protein